MAADVPAPSLAAADDPVVRRLADDGLYLGITAWTEPSLVESAELYPPTVTTAEQRLWLYASRYPVTQVDSTFYRWMDDEHRERTLDFLARHGLAYVCVDEPQGFPSSVPPVAAATADVAEVRFHGRNAEMWEARGVKPVERYDYDYRAEELAEWVPKIRMLHEGGRPVHLLMNNVYRGYAVRGARTLARLLADELG
jgi:uncharacterized protein YecE (DUF72 family)